MATANEARAELARRELARRELDRRASAKTSSNAPVDKEQIMRDAVRESLMGPLANTPLNLMGQAIIDPARTVKKYGAALPIVGGLAGPVGAMAGEGVRQSANSRLNNETMSPKDAALSIGLQGAAAAPINIAKVLAPLGKGAAKFAQAATGGKSQDFLQAARQGMSTYMAPSMKKAGQLFEGALSKAGIKSEPTLSMAVDPQLGVARKVATQAGLAIERGAALSAEKALRARQGVDRIIAATPEKDKVTLKALTNLRGKFSDALANASPEVKAASDVYRKAAVKRTVTSPVRLKKSGEMTATIPILASILGSGVGATTDARTGTGAALGAMAATSPALWGAGFTGAGSMVKLLQIPAVRQAIVSAFMGGGK